MHQRNTSLKTQCKANKTKNFTLVKISFFDTRQVRIPSLYHQHDFTLSLEIIMN